MNRREFLHTASAATVVGGFASLAPFNAMAQSKQETLLLISEGGPNSLDVQGVLSAALEDLRDAYEGTLPRLLGALAP